MRTQLLMCVAVSGLLAGCASLSGEEVPVEDRAGGQMAPRQEVAIGEAVPAGQTARPATEAGRQADAGVSTQGIKGTPISESSRPTVADGKSSQVETRGLPGQDTQVAQLPSGAQDAASGGQPGTTEGPHGGGKDGASSMGAGMDLNAPGSLLAKRIIQFDYDSAALRDEYRELLEAHAGYLKNNSGSKVLLQGHADERGSREYNLALGQRRSESVLQALALLGVNGTQMEAVSLGEEKPLAEGHDEEAWKQNRRAEILYQSE